MDSPFKISAKCCDKMKKKENGMAYTEEKSASLKYRDEYYKGINSIIEERLKGKAIIEAKGSTRGVIDVSLPHLNFKSKILDFGGITSGNKVSDKGRIYAGYNPVTISSIECPEGFSTSLKAGDRITNYTDMAVYFQPTELKEYSGDIKIYSNASNNPYIFHVKGEGK